MKLKPIAKDASDGSDIAANTNSISDQGNTTPP